MFAKNLKVSLQLPLERWNTRRMNSEKLNLIPVVLSGGVGSRLWPKSRFNLPKPFINVWDDCLLSTTVARFAKTQTPWCVTTSSLRVLTEKVFRKHNISPEHVLCEAMGRNTAPAVAFLCKTFEQKGLSQQVVGVFPADHFVEDVDNFNTCLNLAYTAAEAGSVVTLGIIPCEPSTEFGYIEVNQDIKAISPNSVVSDVVSFKEKPSVTVAEDFLRTQKFLWNSGMFIFKISTMIELFKKHQPEMWTAFSDLKPDLSNAAEIYEKLPNISIDYAIIEKMQAEKAQNIKCIPCEMGWSDVGTWDELIKYHGSEQNILFESAKDCHVVSQEKKTYGFIGIDDLIVVDTKDATLIMKKGESAKVSKMVEGLKRDGASVLYATHFEERPWGNFEVLKDECHYKSKMIQIEPGQKLSYQSHQKRAEHWIVVKGQAEVTIDDVKHIVKTSEHIFIPQGAKHRVANPSSEPIELIEVQVGNYFGEDDIQRYQDTYGR